MIYLAIAPGIAELIEETNASIRMFAGNIYPEITSNQIHWVLAFSYFCMGYNLALLIYYSAKLIRKIGKKLPKIRTNFSKKSPPEAPKIQSPPMDLPPPIKTKPALTFPLVKLNTFTTKKMENLQRELEESKGQIIRLENEKAKLQEDLEGLHHLWEVSLAEIKDLRTKHQSLIDRALIVTPINKSNNPTIGTNLEFIDNTENSTNEIDKAL